LIFPPISISGKESVADSSLQQGSALSILKWMNSAKQENRVHAPLEPELKSLVSVQFEIVSSFWLNFPPPIDDIAAVKRCFRLSKVFKFLSAWHLPHGNPFYQALRDQFDKLIAIASKNKVPQLLYFVDLAP
jgi:hypothetical protein